MAILYALILGAVLQVLPPFSAREQFQRNSDAVHVVAPATLPPLTQASIDTAMVLYGIRLPPGVPQPLLDLSIEERGLTRKSPLGGTRVTIGPAAFGSWGLLGSTLAHEIEIHARQHFLKIALLDALHLSGTEKAEREAYRHELRSARRFGLSKSEITGIQETLEYFYSE